MDVQTVTHFRQILINLDSCLEKGVTYAETKKIELDVLANYRLAPDMFTLIKQIQSVCDSAKFCAAYLTEQTPPKHDDTETTWMQMRERLKTVVNYLETFKTADFAKAESVKVKPNWAKGKWISGADYLNQVAVPNFYFHACMAYAILRHAGVNVGKMDYMGPVKLQD